jgi:vanillate/3-O-methylgallate O-demethylase
MCSRPPDAAPWLPENIQPEYAGWQREQAAWHDGVSISDVSHHMFDTVIDGPDATRLLAAVSANNYEKFAVGQAKQFVPVTGGGRIVTDGILHRDGEQRYTLRAPGNRCHLSRLVVGRVSQR